MAKNTYQKLRRRELKKRLRRQTKATKKAQLSPTQRLQSRIEEYAYSYKKKNERDPYKCSWEKKPKHYVCTSIAREANKYEQLSKVLSRLYKTTTQNT